MLFLKFAAIYGQVWRIQFKDDEFLAFAKGQWFEGLKMFDEDTLDLAIDQCRKNIELPPTLPKFVDICRSFHNRKLVVTQSRESSRSCLSMAGKEALGCIRKMLHMSEPDKG